MTFRDAVAQRRHHAVVPLCRFRPRPVAGFCTLYSPSGHWRCFRLLHRGAPASTFLPTFPRRGFALRACRGSSPLRYYAGSDSCRALARPAGLSGPSACLPGIPPPTTSCAWTSRSYHLARPVGSPLGLPGFAIHEQARRFTPPNRVRHPAGYPFASGCSPRRLAATQLPSATYAVTSYGTDFHHADKTNSRTHSWPGLSRPSTSCFLKQGRRGCPAQGRA